MFTHLHYHTSYSFLDGYNPVKKGVARVKELGMQACAITDHNHLGGCPEFQAACKKAGIKPLLGVELYYTEDRHEISKDIKSRKEDARQRAIEAGVLNPEVKMKVSEEKEIIAPYMYDTRSYHILFIAKNQTGWNNLVKIQSVAAKEGKFNGRYHCDMNLLREYSEGIICTTACIGSYSARKLNNQEADKAEEYIVKMKDIFGDDFYLEIQPLVLDLQTNVNKFYIEMAKKHNIKLVATNDVHWTNKEDHDDHDTLLCIGIGKMKSDEDRMRYADDFWIKSEQEMIESFTNQAATVEEKDYLATCLEAVQNTQLVADKVSDDIELGSKVPLFPAAKLPAGFSAEEVLIYKAWKGLNKYLKNNPQLDRKEYERRLHHELEIINAKGYAPYFIAVEEYVAWSRDNNIIVGPGRGSAAGSLALFCLDVTKIIDPIQNNLLFSRFLTADRTALPD